MFRLIESSDRTRPFLSHVSFRNSLFIEESRPLAILRDSADILDNHIRVSEVIE